MEGPSGNVVLIMLFKCYENMCGRKSIVKICIVLFKQQTILPKKTTNNATKHPWSVQTFQIS